MTLPTLPRLARWIVHLAAFPLTGLTVWLLFGPIDSPLTAAGGGAIVGLGVGATQAWALELARPARWTAATVLGLAVGSPLGLLVGGIPGLAITGVALALSQSLARPPLPWVWWSLLVAGGWLLAWAVSLTVALELEQGFVVFGSSGALAFTVLLAVTTALVRRRAAVRA